jgi:hypothetical protein
MKTNAQQNEMTFSHVKKIKHHLSKMSLLSLESYYDHNNFMELMDEGLKDILNQLRSQLMEYFNVCMKYCQNSARLYMVQLHSEAVENESLIASGKMPSSDLRLSDVFSDETIKERVKDSLALFTRRAITIVNQMAMTLPPHLASAMSSIISRMGGDPKYIFSEEQSIVMIFDDIRLDSPSKKYELQISEDLTSYIDSYRNILAATEGDEVDRFAVDTITSLKGKDDFHFGAFEELAESVEVLCDDYNMLFIYRDNFATKLGKLMQKMEEDKEADITDESLTEMTKMHFFNLPLDANRNTIMHLIFAMQQGDQAFRTDRFERFKIRMIEECPFDVMFVKNENDVMPLYLCMSDENTDVNRNVSRVVIENLKQVYHFDSKYEREFPELHKVINKINACRAEVN